MYKWICIVRQSHPGRFLKRHTMGYEICRRSNASKRYVVLYGGLEAQGGGDVGIEGRNGMEEK